MKERDFLMEYENVKRNGGILNLSNRGKIRVRGKDRYEFLESLVTNKVKGLEEGRGLYAFLLNKKGHIENNLRIYNIEESFLIDIEEGFGKDLLTKLLSYRFISQVELKEEELSCISIQGKRSGELVREFCGGVFEGLEEDEIMRWEGGYIIGANETGEGGYNFVLNRDNEKSLWGGLIELGKGLGVVGMGDECFEVLRIEAGIPRMGVDLTEKTSPLETPWKDRGVHYQKGCYIGQEFITRIKMRGRVKRIFVGYEFEEEEGMEVMRDDVIYGGGKEKGWISSVCYSPGLRKRIGMGYMRNERFEVGGRI